MKEKLLKNILNTLKWGDLKIDNAIDLINNPTKCNQCKLENNLGICDKENCINHYN